MNLFEVVKASINAQEAAQAYGIDVNRHGMALCPFHNDRHPSLYVSDDHYPLFRLRGTRGCDRPDRQTV